MNIKLNCKYGNNMPNSTIEVDDKRGASLVKDGLAIEVESVKPTPKPKKPKSSKQKD